MGRPIVELNFLSDSDFSYFHFMYLQNDWLISQSRIANDYTTRSEESGGSAPMPNEDMYNLSLPEYRPKIKVLP